MKNKNTKKSICFVVIMLLISSLSLTACDTKELQATQKKTIDDSKVAHVFSSMAAIPRTGKSYPEKINQAIINMLDLRAIKSTVDASGNIIVDIPATKGYEHLPLLILQCHTDAKIVYDSSILFDPDTDGAHALKPKGENTITSEGTSMGASSAMGISSIINVLYFVTDKKNNFEHGPIRALFLANDGTMSGARNLDHKYVKDGAIMISLDSVDEGDAVINSEFAQDFTSNKKLEPVASTSKYAYAITAYGFPAQRFGAYPDAPNSLKIISEILTNVNSSGIRFELYSLKNNGSNLESATETTVIVGLNEYELNRFRKIYDGLSESFIDEVDPSYIDNGLGIMMTETIPPDNALNQEDASKVITQLYGIFNTNFNSDVEDLSGVFVGNLSITPNYFTSDISILADTMETINISAQKLNEIAKLSEIEFTMKDQIPGINSDPENEFVLSFLNAYHEVSDAKINIDHLHTSNQLGFISAHNPMMPIVSIGVTIKNEDTINESINIDSLSIPANTILRYITTLAEESTNSP